MAIDFPQVLLPLLWYNVLVCRFHNSEECKGDHYRVLNHNSLHCLYIEDTTEGDGGQYTLRASNKNGQMEVFLDVTVLTPIPPQGV